MLPHLLENVPSSVAETTLHKGVSLAHLSDPHLPPPHIPWTAFFNKRLLSRTLWVTRRLHVHRAEITAQLIDDIRHTPDIQALLISGDQTNFGTMEEYLAAAQWFKSLPAPVYIVPGNHDTMAPIARHKSLDLWQEWAGPDYPYCRTIGKIAIIGLNSALPTLPFTAYGFLRKKHYRRLSALLEHYGKNGYCRVVMIHHPPRKGLLPYRKSLLDTDKLAALLKHYGAELVLHGHSHNATFTTVEGTHIPLLGISSASMKSNRLHRIASWNHLHFLKKENSWHITVKRRSYKGRLLAEYNWHTDNKNAFAVSLSGTSI